MACTTDCTLVDINTDNSCNLFGGIKVAYWTLGSNIDFAATAADPLLFDTTNEEILGWSMVGPAVWNKISFKQKGSNYTQSFARDSQFYDVNINMIFEGKGRVLRNALCRAISCCDIVLHVFDQNCDERIFGYDWDGDSFNQYIEPLKIVTHDDNSGDFGGDLPTDNVTFGGESRCPALYGGVGQTAFETAYL